MSSTQRGFGIIDSLIAITITLVAVVAMLGAIPLAFSATNQSAVQLQALAAAQQYLEAIRQSVSSGGNGTLPSAPTIAVDTGTSLLGNGGTTTGGGYFVISNNGCPLLAGSTVRYDCSVSAAWTQAGVSRSVSLEAYVAHQ